MVDSKYSGFDVIDQLLHKLTVAKNLHEKTIGPRPRIESEFFNACKFCPMAKVCDEYDDKGMTPDEFINKGANSILNPNKPTKE
jgi:hypothetical protein